MSHCHGVSDLRNQTLLGMCFGHSEAMKGREGVAWQHLEQSMTPSLFGSLRMSSEKRVSQRDTQKLQVHSGAPLTPGFSRPSTYFPSLTVLCFLPRSVHRRLSVTHSFSHVLLSCPWALAHLCFTWEGLSLPPTSLGASLIRSLFMEVADAPEWFITLFVVKNLEGPWG